MIRLGQATYIFDALCFVSTLSVQRFVTYLVVVFVGSGLTNECYASLQMMPDNTSYKPVSLCSNGLVLNAVTVVNGV